MSKRVEIDFEELMSLAEDGEQDVGVCLACGEIAYGVEPDARRYKCECCGERMVYGVEEVLMMC